MAFDKKTYDREFHKEKYDTVRFTIPKGMKDNLLKPLAEDRGLSMSQLIIEAIEDKYNVSLRK